MKDMVRWLVVLLIILPACERTEVIPLPGNALSGTVSTTDEFGATISDNAGVTITVKDTDPLLSTVSDADGKFEIQGIPAGTYDFEFAKEGYGILQFQGIRILGATKLQAGKVFIAKKSTITIVNPTLEVQGSDVYLRCVVNHDYIPVQGQYASPALLYVIGYSEDVSDMNYITIGYMNVDMASGSEILKRIIVNRAFFPSGSRIYLRVYGCTLTSNYFDIMSGRYIYPNAGLASDVATITVP